MNVNAKKEENTIIVINSLKEIMKIFLGPFLTAYFIKVSQESILYLSIYYIISYTLLIIGILIVAHIIKNKFRIGMFRIGVILNFVYIISIIILKEKIIKYIWLISILYGISASTYWLPYNLFVSSKIKNSKRTEYTVKLKIAASLVNILAPFLLGTLINITNYELTAIIILLISIIQIIFSFKLTPDESINLSKCNCKKTIKLLKDNKQIRKICIVEFLAGMNISDAALKILITIIIFNSFKTNLNLGIINSITAIFAMICVHLYGKIYKNKSDKNFIIASSVLPVIALFAFLILKNNPTMIIYNIFYITLIYILKLTREIRIFNISDSSIVDRNNQCEFMAMREGILNFGRITGYSIMLFAGLSNSQLVLNIALIFLTLSMPIMGIIMSKIEKFENNTDPSV